MCVVYGHAVYMHTGYGVGVSLRISNPGWKNFIYDILCNIDLCSETYPNKTDRACYACSVGVYDFKDLVNIFINE
jgi:hypothetical protein